MKHETKREKNALPPHAESSGLRIAGGIVLIVSLLFCVWLMGGAVAYNWLAHDYGKAIGFFGRCYFVLAGIMTAGVVLYFCRRDLLALIFDAASYLPMRLFLLIAMQKAEKNGWSGQTEASFGVQAAEKWHTGMMWTALPFLLLLVLALTRFRSQDEKVRRHAKRQLREKERNRPAPSILGGETPEQPDSPKAAGNRQKNTKKPSRKKK
ncbi:MAG: hypothetical protein IJ060_11755 [Oscillospiraceae bacterium]|nr:hypothetical protein [Oscillospiraceae bacterium]